jgi:hypothetical protein
VVDAVGVGNDDRRALVGFRFPKGPDGLGHVGPH